MTTSEVPKRQNNQSETGGMGMSHDRTRRVSWGSLSNQVLSSTREICSNSGNIRVFGIEQSIVLALPFCYLKKL